MWNFSTTGILAVAAVPEEVSDGTEPEDAEDADGGKAFGPKSNVASCVAAAEIVGGTGAWVGDVQVG